MMSRPQSVAQGQLDVMRKQFEMADRPWLSIEVAPISGFYFYSTNASFEVQYTIKNVGHSVATGVTVNSTVFTPKIGDAFFKEPVQRQKAFCGNVSRSQTEEDISTAIAVFPNETRTLNHSLAINNSEMVVNCLKDRNVVLPMIVGCVDYVYGDQTSHHQTHFIYQVQYVDPARDPTIPRTISVGENVPADQVVLIKYYFGGDYAN